MVVRGASRGRAFFPNERVALIWDLFLRAFKRVCTQGGPGGECKETINEAVT